MWIVGLLSLLIATPALAGSAFRCEELFAPEASPGLFSKINEFRLSRHEQKLERALKMDSPALEDWVRKHFTLQYGKRLGFRDYMVLSKDQQAQKLLFRKWQEKTVEEGFASYGEILGLQEQMTFRDHARFAIRRSVGLVLSFPHFRDVKVSAAQLEKWVYEGTAKNDQEITDYLRQQGRVESKRHIKSIIQKVALASFIIYNAMTWEERAEQFQKLLIDREFDNLVESFSGLDRMVLPYVQANYQSMIDAYVKRYHEEPTSEEKKEMLRFSFKEFGLNPNENN